MTLLLLLLVSLFQLNAVSPCVRVYETCCSSIKTTDVVNSRFPDNTDIIYTEPEITIDPNCQSAQIDCALPGMDTEIYTLIFSDGNGNILNTKPSKTSVFNTSTSDISCDTGYQNKDVFLSCEQGCTLDTCGPIRGCTCSPIQDWLTVQSRTKRHQTMRDANSTAIYGDNCQNITIICDENIPQQPNNFTGIEVITYNGDLMSSIILLNTQNSYSLTIDGLKCENFKWMFRNQTMDSFIVACILHYDFIR